MSDRWKIGVCICGATTDARWPSRFIHRSNCPNAKFKERIVEVVPADAVDEFVLAVATEAGEDVSDGLPTWPDPRTWALDAVREAQRDMDDECQRLHAEVERLRAALEQIAKHPTTELNPDGDDQAAWSMQLLAGVALEQTPASTASRPSDEAQKRPSGGAL